MQHQNGNKLIEKLLKDIKKKGFEASELIEGLQELRKFALEIQDPLLTRLCRLAYERIEETGTFDAIIWEEDFESDVSPMEYFLQLMLQSENKNNREELQQYRDVLLGKPINQAE